MFLILVYVNLVGNKIQIIIKDADDITNTLSFCYISTFAVGRRYVYRNMLGYVRIHTVSSA